MEWGLNYKVGQGHQGMPCSVPMPMFYAYVSSLFYEMGMIIPNSLGGYDQTCDYKSSTQLQSCAYTRRSI